MLELKQYASRPVQAIQVNDVNEDGLEVFGLFKDSEDKIRIIKTTKKINGELVPFVRMKVLTGRGNAKSWRTCEDGNWVFREHDGTMRVFQDRSFRNAFQGPIEG